jgi:hypothetical protein
MFWKKGADFGKKNQLLRPPTGLCLALPNFVRKSWTMSDWDFQPDVHSQFWLYLANWVSNWSHSFFATFITSRGLFLRCWLVCSSPFCSLLALGIELGTQVGSCKIILIRLPFTPPPLPLRLPPSVLQLVSELVRLVVILNMICNPKATWRKVS